MTLDEDIQTVNWPQESGDYKVVQLEVDGEPYLRFKTEEFDEHHHGGILAIFLRTNYVSFQKLEEGDAVKYPTLKGNRYEVQGMGHAILDVEQKQATLYGASFDYAIRINEEHLRDIKPLAPNWNIKFDDSLLYKRHT